MTSTRCPSDVDPAGHHPGRCHAHSAEVKYGAAGEDEQVVQLLIRDGGGFVKALSAGAEA